MSDYIEIYEKEDKKERLCFRIIIIISVLACLVSFYLLKKYDKSLLLMSVPMLLFAILIRHNKLKTQVKFINKINATFRSNLDVQWVISVHEELLKNRRWKNHSAILLSYLTTLFMIGDFEKFETVYGEHRKVFRKIPMDVSLESLQQMFYSLEKDRNEYRKLLFSNKTNTSLCEIEQLYEMKEYKKVLEKISQMNHMTPYEELIYESYKQRSLYYMKEKYDFPKKTSYLFVPILQWRNLLETGEEYTYLRAKEVIEILENDISVVKNKRRCWGIISIVCWIILAFLVLF